MQIQHLLLRTPIRHRRLARPLSQSTEEIEKLLKEAEAERRELLARKKNRELLLQLQRLQAENAMLRESFKDPPAVSPTTPMTARLYWI